MSMAFSPTARSSGRLHGEESKRFSFADIMGISLLRRLGIKMALISGEPSPLVDRYAEKMHIPFVLKGTRDKAAALRDFTTKFDIPLEQTCFFGDDVNDLSAMEIAGLCACPSNAAAEVLAHVAEHGYFRRCPVAMALSAPSPTPSSPRANSVAVMSFNFVRRSNPQVHANDDCE